MRPLRLTMQAFGPYAGSETVDFNKLGSRTMFVISGKTGSGKTTIFDGISYAIYGRASGEDRNGPELRSQFAKDDLLTEVELEFSLRGKTYSITRSPQQDKKKERGDGVRTIGAKAELYTIKEDGEKELLAANVRDVDEKIKEIMLIDSNQFRQILMIPQGEFRKLLTSESKEKELILQRLFHTEIYKRVEERLKDEATELKRSVEKQLEERNFAIGKIYAIFQEELKGYLEAGSVNDTYIFPLLENEITLMAEKLEELAGTVKEKQLEKDALQQKLFEAETIVKQLKAKEELALRKVQLEEQKDFYEKKEQDVVLAQKAAILAQQEELCHRLKRDLDQAKSELEQRRENVDQLTLALKQREEAWLVEKGREEERKAAQDEVAKLENIREDVRSFAMSQQEVHSLKLELEKAKQLGVTEQDRLKNLEENVKALVEEKQQIEKSQLTSLENDHKIEKLTAELEKMSKYEQQSARLKQAEVVLKAKHGEFQNTEVRLQDAKQLVETLEQRWLNGQASILARALHSGEACPVCGSDHHPSPATESAHELPSDEDIKAAKQQVSVIENERLRAQTSFMEAQTNVKTLEQTMSDLAEEIISQREEFTDENLAILKNTIVSEREALLEEQKRFRQLKLKLEKLTSEIANGESTKEKLAANIQQLTEKVTELTISFTEKNTNLARMMEKIPESLRSVEVFEQKWKQAIQAQQQLQKQLETAQQLFQETKEKFSSEQARFETVQKLAVEQEEKLKVEREAFVSTMQAQGFDTYAVYHSAKRTEAELQQIQTAVRQYREELRSVTDRFNELSELLKDIQQPDLDGLNTAFQQIQEQLGQLQQSHTNLFMKKSANEEIRDRITAINSSMKALEDRYKLVGHLYEISKGQNTYRITFERFVLAAFLDDILREANGRLTKMTSGRYQLLRKTDRSKGNVQSGLELLVFDQYTGQERHVKTLSGGESFKAALSLALGLADVVQAYAGGVSLETMFIDEGFGTLDPESLDQAIEALIDIQSSGRLVGIISHVPELKERIDVRLEVIATQAGSKTEFQFLN